jgi:hypothetical protein
VSQTHVRSIRRLALAVFAWAVAGALVLPPGQALAGQGIPSQGRPIQVPDATRGVPLPESGALFGAAVAVGDRMGTSQWLATQTFEDLIGRETTLEREYMAWDEAFPRANEYLARDLGRTMLLSWNAGLKGREGQVSWAEIASGSQDSVIDARAADLKTFGAPLFLAFHHEPNGQNEAGTAAEYVDAFRHVRNRFVAKGVTNVSYMLIMWDTAYESGGAADDYYPGDAYVDVLGVDAYNWYGCPGRNDPWRSFEEKAQAFYDFGVAHGKPMVVAELGSTEDPADPNRKAQWFNDAATTLKSWPEVKGVAYYNNGAPNTCDWWVDTSPQSLAAFQEMGADPYFNPALAAPPATNVSAYVNVLDGGFSVVNGSPVQGKKVKWLFQGGITHSVTDSSGMGLFDSGLLAQGKSWSFKFVGAANYTYKCSLNGSMTSTIKVPLIMSPLSGGLATPFTLTWGSGAPPAGYVYDVQIQRPGSQLWENWKKDTTTRTGTFVADSGTGTYSFRSRIEKSSNAKRAGWTKVVSITVAG